jgi:hypothetical protein
MLALLAPTNNLRSLLLARAMVLIAVPSKLFVLLVLRLLMIILGMMKKLKKIFMSILTFQNLT